MLSIFPPFTLLGSASHVSSNAEERRRMSFFWLTSVICLNLCSYLCQFGYVLVWEKLACQIIIDDHLV